MSGHESHTAPFGTPDAYYFDGGRFEPRSGRLVHDGEDIRLRPKTAGVLAALLERAGDVVSKVELLDRVWLGAAGDESLAVCVAELRRALHEDPKEHRLVGTVHRRGYRFLGDVRTSPPEPVSEDTPVLVGRESALAVLSGWWESAKAGERTTGFVAGEAGAGKTALVHAFLDDVRAQDGAAIGEGRCADRHGAEPYLPLLDVLTSLSRGANGARFRELLWELAPSWLLQLPGFARDDTVERLRHRSPDDSPGRLWREAAEVLDAFALTSPVVVVLEDVHTCDRATLELVSYLAERPTRARLLLLATYRPDDGPGSGRALGEAVDSLRARRRCEHHELAPLDDAAIGTLLRVRLAPASPAQGLVREVLGRTEGNALFVTTLVDRLIDDGALDEVDGVCQARAPIHELGVPRTVRQLIVERIARLDDADRRTLQAGAAAGLEFTSAEAAAGVAPLSESEAVDPDAREVERRLLRIAGATGVLAEVGPATWPDGSISARFRFRHELVREVLHAQLGGARHVLVHRAIGTMLDGSGRHGDREPTVLAEHFELGMDFGRAAVHYARASDAARARLAPLQALDLARRGAALAMRPGVELAPDARLELQVGLLAATLAVHGVAGPEVDAVLQEAEAVVESVPDRESAARARYLFWSVAFMAGDIRTATRRLAALERSAAEGDDDLLALQVENARTVTSFAAGAPGAALAHAERFRSLEQARSVRDGGEHAAYEIAMLNRSSTALASWLVGRADDALRIAHDGLRIARAHGSPALVCRSLWPVAAVHQMCGERDAVSRYADEIRSLAEADAGSRWVLVGSLFASWAGGAGPSGVRGDDGGDGGDGRTAAERTRACLDALVADGMGFGRPYHLALVAEAALAARDPAPALAAADDAIAASERTGDRWYLPELMRLRAETLLELAAVGSPSRRAALGRDADRELAAAASLARSQGAVALERRAAATRVGLRMLGVSRRDDGEPVPLGPADGAAATPPARRRPPGRPGRG